MSQSSSTPSQASVGLPWADGLRSLATISVILLHVSAVVLLLYGEVPMRSWAIANVYDGLVRCCVPLFFMLSGALLLGKQEPLTVFLRKRLLRILPPFLFWSLVYIAVEIGRRALDGDLMNLEDMWHLTWMRLLYGSSFHLWFVYTLLGLYLIIPILRKWLNTAGTTEMRYFLLIWAVTLLFEIPAVQPWVPNIELRYFAGYVGYLVLGHYLSQAVTSNIPRWMPWAMILVGSAITILGTHWLSAAEGQLNDQFHGYLTVNVCLVAIGVFLVMKNGHGGHPWLARLDRSISRYSYGIYLVHVLVLTLMSMVGLKFLWLALVFRIPLLTVLCLAISWALMAVFAKLPGGRYITG